MKQKPTSQPKDSPSLGKEHLKIIASLEKLINIKIVNPQRFLEALTHRSYLEINEEFKNSNERLEFLGDAVLEIVVSEYLFQEYPNEEEGFLTKSRSQLVNKKSLTYAAENLHLENYILADKNFIEGNKEGRKSIMADTLEALIGVIYSETGLDKSRDFITKHIIHPNMADGILDKDDNYKGQLLEIAHTAKSSSPYYKVIKEIGPDHEKEFTVEVFIDDKLFGKGKGKNKKSAEQKAAKNALKKITSSNKHPL